MSITLKVSIGEALDKLSILGIKLSKIFDRARRADVQTEYDAIEPTLRSHVESHSKLFNLLNLYNLMIWETQDTLRESDLSGAVKEYTSILDHNDARFRCKKKINNACASVLKEQKGYSVKAGIVSSTVSRSVVRWAATWYDVVYIVDSGVPNSLERHASSYLDDPDIRVCTDNTVPPATATAVAHTDYPDDLTPFDY